MTIDQITEFMRGFGLRREKVQENGTTGWFTLYFSDDIVVNMYPSRNPVISGSPGALLNKIKAEWSMIIAGHRQIQL